MLSFHGKTFQEDLNLLILLLKIIQIEKKFNKFHKVISFAHKFRDIKENFLFEHFLTQIMKSFLAEKKTVHYYHLFT